MRYIVDTSVWSLALRKKALSPTNEIAVRKLKRLIDYGEQILLLGIIVQDLLQGIRDPEQFAKVRRALSYYEILQVGGEDHVFAAELFNKCRSKGVTASSIDFLIASMAIRHDCRLLTTGKDFEHIARHSELVLT
jgi:predicted nucleic acid-binding protein